MNRIKRFEGLFVEKVYKALQAHISSFIRDYKKYGQDYAVRTIGQDERIGKVISRMYKYITPLEARIVYGDILKKYGVPVKRASFGFSDTWNKDVERYLERYLLDKAVLPISARTKDFILRILKKGVEEGWGVERIVRELKESDITKNRARTIVRTESVRAANIGYMIGAFDSPWEQVKEWVAVDDARTRPTHRHSTGVDGEKRDFLKPFSNGLLYPGDPNAPAKEVINCRCRVTFRVKRDAKGNPIPKRQVSPVRNRIIDILFMGFIEGAVQRVIDNLMSE